MTVLGYLVDDSTEDLPAYVRPMISINPENYIPRWINVKQLKNIPPKSWRGLSRGDGKYRLYQKKSSSKTLRHKYQRGKLMSSFTRIKLLKIAWKVGVSNPDGFDRADSLYMKVSHHHGFKLYLQGWDKTNKKTLMRYIWNRFEETEQVLMA